MTIAPQLGPAFPVVIPIGGPKNHLAEPGQEQMPAPGSTNPEGGSGAPTSTGPVQGLAEAAMWKAMGDVVVARLTGQSARAAATSMLQTRLRTSFAELDDGLPPYGPGLGMGAAPPPGPDGYGKGGTYALTPANGWAPGGRAMWDAPSISRMWMGAEPPAGFTPITLGGMWTALPGGDGGVGLVGGGRTPFVIGLYSNFQYYSSVLPPGSKGKAALVGLAAAAHPHRPRRHSAPPRCCRSHKPQRFVRLRAHALGSTFL